MRLAFYDDNGDIKYDYDTGKTTNLVFPADEDIDGILQVLREAFAYLNNNEEDLPPTKRRT